MTSRKPNSRKRQPKNRGLSYQALESRQMLAVDLGIQVETASTLDLDRPFLTSDVSGDVGPNHTVESVNGEIDIRLLDGSLLQRRTLQQFWQAAGADLVIGFDSGDNPILGSIQDTRVLFDSDTGNWFVTSVIADRDGSALPGNEVLLAVSRTNNPVDGFQSVQFVGDTTGDHYNSFTTLAADANGVFITTNNEIDPLNQSVSIYAIPKFDLTGNLPSIANLSRFENMDPAVYGQTIQFATDADADNGRSLALGTFNSGSAFLSVIEVNNLGTGNPVTLTNTATTVGIYNAAPDGRQLNAVTRLNNISPEITGNVVEHGGYLWTAHTVEGDADNSAIRWYQIDSTTLDVIASDTIQNEFLDYLYPSIDVSSEGVIAIGFTGTGLQQAASSFLTMGYLTNGLNAVPTVTFDANPTITTQGLDNFENIQDGLNRFGEYSSTHFDPDDPFSVFSFQQYVSDDDEWSTSIVEASLVDIEPVIMANDDANDVIVRLSAANPALVEIVIDGNVTDIFERESIQANIGSNGLIFELGDGDDTITIDNSNGTILDFGADFEISAGLGMDTLQIIDTNGHLIEVTGAGSGGFVALQSGAGNGLFDGLETIIGTDGDDIFRAQTTSSDWMFRGGMGDDLFDIFNTATGNFDLFGEAGNDTYRLPLANFDSITVEDSIDDENDSLVGLGTLFDDTLTINNENLTFNGIDVSNFGFEGIEQLDFDGLEGDDTFNIQAIATDLQVSGGGGDDIFNVSSDAPDNTGSSTNIQGPLAIDGGTGNNQLAVSNAGGFQLNVVLTANQISGMSLFPITFSGNFGTAADGTPGIILTGSNLASDSFDIRQVVEGNSVLAIGGAGEDLFNVRPNTIGDVYLDGGENSDTYRTTFATDNDHVVKIIESGADDARDRFSIRVTQGDDVFNIGNMSLNSSRNFLSWNENIENVVVDTQGGNDTVTVRSNVAPFVRIALSDGDDTGIVDGTLGISTLKFQGQSGNDQFDFQNSVAASFVQALGGDGNDNFVVGATSFARSRVDGEFGNDSANVFFAARDNRRVNARDTGGGFDTLLVTGTMAADRVDLQNRLISRDGEFVTYDENTEDFDMNLIGSNDVLNIFGTSVLQFDANLGVGNDTVNVFSTSTPNDSVGFTVSLSNGNDTANVFRIAENARVDLFGQLGNDVFNIGSNSTDNTGNLSRIRGELFVQGGSDTPGVDTLQVNDFAALSDFSYMINDTSFQHDADNSPFNRPFEGFNHGGMEFVFVYGTDGDNHFTVTPSLNAVIRLLGNGGIDGLTIDSDESRQFFGQPSEGFIAFSEGSRNVSYVALEDLSGAQS